MADEPAQTEATEQAPAETSPAVDLQPLMDRFDDFGDRLSRLEPQQEPVQEPDPYDALRQYDDLYQGLEPEQPAQPQQPQGPDLVDTLKDTMEKAIEAKLSPYIQTQEAERREQEAAALMDEYPDLRDDQKVQHVVGQTQELVDRLSRRGLMGPEAWREPELVELVYLAEQARNVAASETPAGGESEVSLEGGGGSSPAPSEDDTPDRIVQARGGGLNPFWTG